VLEIAQNFKTDPRFQGSSELFKKLQKRATLLCLKQ